MIISLRNVFNTAKVAVVLALTTIAPKALEAAPVSYVLEGLTIGACNPPYCPFEGKDTTVTMTLTGNRGEMAVAGTSREEEVGQDGYYWSDLTMTLKNDDGIIFQEEVVLEQYTNFPSAFAIASQEAVMSTLFPSVYIQFTDKSLADSGADVGSLSFEDVMQYKIEGNNTFKIGSSFLSSANQDIPGSMTIKEFSNTDFKLPAIPIPPTLPLSLLGIGGLAALKLRRPKWLVKTI